MSKFRESLRFYLALLRIVIARVGVRDDKRWPAHQWILGHRGARSLAPENTLVSFRLAMEHGADGVEFDVIPSKDGVPMIIHDDFLERSTNGHGIVWQYDSKTLGELDATKLKPGFKKEGVPTLLATLEALPDGAFTNIELKNRGDLTEQQFVLRVLKDIEQHEHRLLILVSSFDAELLKILRGRRPSSLIALLLSEEDYHWHRALSLAASIKPDALHLTQKLATPLARFLAQRARMRIALWTINDGLLAKHWFKNGVDGIFTDNVPEIVKAIREEYHSSKSSKT